MRVLIIVFLVFSSFSLLAQDRLEPAKRYNEGDVIFSPVFGIKSVVPKGWYGVLPRDTEIFLLMPLNGAGEIYVSADSINEDQLKDRWLIGLELGNGNQLLSDGNIIERNGALSSNVVMKQKTFNEKAYVEGKCSAYNRCIGAMLVAPVAEFETKKKALQEFIDNIVFEAPSSTGLYDTFNWTENLANKRLLHHSSYQGGKAENEIRLCADGTFYMNLKRTRALKADASQYRGKNNGTWKTSSVGPTGKLTLVFDKGLPDLTVDLKIDSDQIFFNNQRYFMMYGQTCR